MPPRFYCSYCHHTYEFCKCVPNGCDEPKTEDPIKKHFSELGKKSWEKRKASLLQVKKQTK